MLRAAHANHDGIIRYSPNQCTSPPFAVCRKLCTSNGCEPSSRRLLLPTRYGGFKECPDWLNDQD
jgi:hypothetical protein